MNNDFVELWDATLTNTQFLLIGFFLSAAALAIFSGFLRAWLGRNEVGPRYRSSPISRLSATAIMFMTYVGAVAQTRLGYDLEGGLYVPNSGAMDTFSLRAMAWSVALPLVAAAFIAVTALAGVRARWAITLASFFSFATVLCAYLGGFVLDRDDRAGIVTWAILGIVFLLCLNAVLIGAIRESAKSLTVAAAKLLRQAYVTFAVALGVFFIATFLQICTSGGTWAAVVQIISSVGDIGMLVVVGELIHRVAKLRTAEDVRAGIDVHPEAIWISSVKQSDAGRPTEVYLDADATVHDRRPKPPTSSAVALEEYDVPEVTAEEFLAEETPRH